MPQNFWPKFGVSNDQSLFSDTVGISWLVLLEFSCRCFFCIDWPLDYRNARAPPENGTRRMWTSSYRVLSIKIAFIFPVVFDDDAEVHRYDIKGGGMKWQQTGRFPVLEFVLEIVLTERNLQKRNAGYKWKKRGGGGQKSSTRRTKRNNTGEILCKRNKKGKALEGKNTLRRNTEPSSMCNLEVSNFEAQAFIVSKRTEDVPNMSRVIFIRERLKRMERHLGA